MTPEFSLTVTGAPMISLRKLEGSLPSPWAFAPFSMTLDVIYLSVEGDPGILLMRLFIRLVDSA